MGLLSLLLWVSRRVVPRRRIRRGEEATSSSRRAKIKNKKKKPAPSQLSASGASASEHSSEHSQQRSEWEAATEESAVCATRENDEDDPQLRAGQSLTPILPISHMSHTQSLTPILPIWHTPNSPSHPFFPHVTHTHLTTTIVRIYHPIHCVDSVQLSPRASQSKRRGRLTRRRVSHHNHSLCLFQMSPPHFCHMSNI